jgi:hypothetical protein
MQAVSSSMRYRRWLIASSQALQAVELARLKAVSYLEHGQKIKVRLTQPF